jgi:hypothetical protein
MNPRLFRSFSTELMKMAADIQDADIRDLLAIRRDDEDHLPQGKLPTNALDDERDIYVQKLSYMDPSVGVASGAHDLHAKKKKNNSYQKIRDYAASGIRGGLTGLALYGAHRTMSGQFNFPSNAAAAARKAKNLASIGAGVSLADRAYRHDDIPGSEKSAMIQANPGRSFGSPATALGTAQKTGGFKTTVVRNGGRPPRLIQLGRKFLGR